MRHEIAAGWLLSLFSSVSLGQVPASDLYAPPADARHFIIESTGRKARRFVELGLGGWHSRRPRKHEPSRSGLGDRL